MPCPTGSFKIISRGKGQSCMASCAYYSGEKKYSEYECCWKYPHSSLSRVKLVEVMLPPNAPKAYADPQTLWNAVDAAETSVNAQTARSMLFALPRELTYEQNLVLVRDFCQKEFVDKGMICNFFYHDKGDGNPHVHIMLTLRAMDENGKWLPKSKNVYALDENGNRIRAPNGSWKRVKVDTVDWNERRYGEIWRQDWAAAQNASLKAAGRMERVDMRSLERQGVEDRLPQKHLGPTASALERKGVSSERGDENRKIISVNKMLASLQKTVRGIGDWLDELRKAVSRQQIIESPDDYPLSDVITAYLDMRKDGREIWNRYAQEKGAVHDLKDGFKAVSFLSNHELYTVGQLGQYIAETKQEFSQIKAESAAKERRIRDIDALFGAIQTIRELKPIQQEYESIHWNSKREKYKAEHSDELSRLQKAIWLREKLMKLLGLASPLDKEQRTTLKAERAQLEAEREALLPKLQEVKDELAELNRIRYWTRKVIPDALPRVSDGRVSVEDAMETAVNRKELEEITEETEQRVTRQQSEHGKNQKNQSPKDKLI
jgi:plasmid mobilization system relaxase